MFKLAEIDAHVSHAAQLPDNSPEPITLLNTFHVNPTQVEAFLAEWGDIVREFKSQPGQLATQVYRGVGGSGTVVIQAVWESVAHYRAAWPTRRFRLGWPKPTTRQALWPCPICIIKWPSQGYA